MKKLNLTSLRKALTSLQKAIERYGREPEDEEVRDSAIQRFETSYELCWKMLSKELQQRTPSPSQIPSLDFKSLMREEPFGLIDDPEAWFEYRRMRNITSHSYDEATAEKVAGSAKSFLKDAKSLLEALEKGFLKCIWNFGTWS